MRYLYDETGLVYDNYRFYAPEMGRWTKRDDIGEDGSPNLYGMVVNNPLYWWDRLGLSSSGMVKDDAGASCCEDDIETLKIKIEKESFIPFMLRPGHVAIAPPLEQQDFILPQKLQDWIGLQMQFIKDI